MVRFVTGHSAQEVLIEVTMADVFIPAELKPEHSIFINPPLIYLCLAHCEDHSVLKKDHSLIAEHFSG
jgi:hypothetical protein